MASPKTGPKILGATNGITNSPHPSPWFEKKGMTESPKSSPKPGREKTQSDSPWSSPKLSRIKPEFHKSVQQLSEKIQEIPKMKPFQIFPSTWAKLST